MEMEPGEGKKHEMRETPEEETREGAEPDDMPMGKTSRKRSAKGAKNTKAPMDGGMYSKKPMDGEGCNCGKRKAKCDGSCGKKMDRNDALTPQEYLAACDLGIQKRPRTYIRARLDAASRLDLKCGNGAISEGETCHKGKAQSANTPMDMNVLKAHGGNQLFHPDRYLHKKQTGGTGRGYIRTRASSLAKKTSLATGVLGGLAGAAQGYKEGGLTGALLQGTGGAVGGAIGGAVNGYVLGGLGGAAEKAIGLRSARTEYKRRRRYGDSVFAAGFSPELDRLAS